MVIVFCADHLVFQVIDYTLTNWTAGHCYIVRGILYSFTFCHLLVSCCWHDKLHLSGRANARFKCMNFIVYIMLPIEYGFAMFYSHTTVQWGYFLELSRVVVINGKCRTDSIKSSLIIFQNKINKEFKTLLKNKNNYLYNGVVVKWFMI